jgi:hypothetical protein
LFGHFSLNSWPTSYARIRGLFVIRCRFSQACALGLSSVARFAGLVSSRLGTGPAKGDCIEIGIWEQNGPDTAGSKFRIRFPHEKNHKNHKIVYYVNAT